MRIIRQSSYAAVPWKNGGGITHEAIRVPPGDDAFCWRVSLARIDASGPFSDFAGYRRYMVLLKGAGVVLRFTSRVAGAVAGRAPAEETAAGGTAAGSPAPRQRELRRIGDVAEFDGGPATHCDLLGGPCVDLNLMVSKTLPHPRVRVEALAKPRVLSLGSGQSMLVLPIDATVELRSGSDAGVLEPWDLALLSDRDDPAVHIEASGRGGAAGAVKVFLAELRAE